jgi:hypothetical protein
MPSQYSNLNFHNRADIRRWKQLCEDQRHVALRWPAYDPRMSGVEEYGFRLGPWSLRLVLEIWYKPYFWHASAACFEQIGFETVPFEAGPMAGAKVEVPQDALIAVSSWEPEHFEQARYIMAEMVGPYLTPGDKFQPAEERKGLWALHWRIRYDGPESWKRNQN